MFTQFVRMDVIQVQVIAMFTWKPPDEELMLKAAKESGAAVAAEDRNAIRGLGSVVANCLVKSSPAIQEFVGIQDEFDRAGSRLPRRRFSGQKEYAPVSFDTGAYSFIKQAKC